MLILITPITVIADNQTNETINNNDFLTSENISAELIIFLLITILLIYLVFIIEIFSYITPIWFLYWGLRLFQSGVDTYIALFTVMIGIIFLFIPINQKTQKR